MTGAIVTCNLCPVGRIPWPLNREQDMETSNRHHANRPTAYARPAVRVARPRITVAMVAPRIVAVLVAVVVIGGVM